MKAGRSRLFLLAWALLAGVCLWLPVPGGVRPLGGLLALAALVPLLLLVRPGNGLGAGQAWWSAFLAGTVYYALSDIWLVHHFAWIFPFKSMGSAAVMLIGLLLFRRLASRVPLPLAAGLGWCAGEWLRVRFPELPYPHHQLAHSLYLQSWFVGSASYLGETGLNFLAAFSSGALAWAWVSWREGRPRRTKALAWGGAALGLLVLNGALAHWSLARVRTRPGPTVGLVQGMLPLFEKSLKGTELSGFEEHLELTRLLGRGGPVDLLVWSETTFPIPIVLAQGSGVMPTVWGGRMDLILARRDTAYYARRILQAASLKRKGGLVVGALALCPCRQEPGLLVPENRAFLWDGEGRLLGSVSKRNLVPGGEFLPFLRRLPFGWGRKATRFFQKLGVPTLQAGRGPLTLKLPSTGKFGLAICYDNAFPDHFARATREGALWHLVLSNEAWYENGAELDQMLAMTVFRAVECRRAVVRCTNSGITCLVGPDGRIGPVLVQKGRDRGFRGILRVHVPLSSGTTWTASVSGWPGLGVWIFAFLLAFFLPPWPGGVPGGRMARIPKKREVSP